MTALGATIPEIGDPAAAVVVAGGILVTLLGAVALYRALTPDGGRGRRLWLPAALVTGTVVLGVGALVYHERDTVALPRWTADPGAVKSTVPVDAWLHYGLGSAYARLGARAAAITQLRAAIRLAPDESRFHRALGEVYRSEGDLGRAQQEFQAALRKEIVP